MYHNLTTNFLHTGIRLLLSCLLLLATVTGIKATHIVGGELNYRFIGNNRYEIRLTVYRDCFNGIPPFDNPASLGIFNSANNLYTSVNLQFKGSDTLKNSVNTPCFSAPASICYEVTTYIDTIVLPPIAGGYQLSYQRCCRNHSIQNIIAPGATGATYYATLPDTSKAKNNSNPVFVKWPPAFICLNIPFIFDHSAIDYDGDSLVYELCDPFHGGSQNQPMPQPPFSPPYSSVTWQAPYSLLDMLGGIPLDIDPVSGLITATPGNIGQFVVGICVSEFRNGIYIGQTKRDFQLNVINCPTILVARFNVPPVVCGTKTVQFNNMSIGSAGWNWDFGVPGSVTDTSTAFNPSFTYPDTGTYTVTMVAYSSFNPACTDTMIRIVKVLPELIGDFSYSLDPCNNKVTFRDTSNLTSGVTSQWSWNFGDGGTSAAQNPTHTYVNPGTYVVSLAIISSQGCRDTVTRPVEVKSLLTTSITPLSTISCSLACDASATVNVSGGTGPYTYSWNDSGNQKSQTAVNLCAGTYSVIVADSNGCNQTLNVTFTDPPLLKGVAGATEAYCGGICIGTALATPSGGTPPWTYSWNTFPPVSTGYINKLCPGNYKVIVKDARGCTWEDSVVVSSSNFIISVEATVDDSIVFAGQTTWVHATTGQGYTYQWFPPAGLSNTLIPSPAATPLTTTMYYITVTDSNGCSNIDSVLIKVKVVLCDEPEIFIPNAFTPNRDKTNDVVYVRGGSISDMTFAIYDRWGEKMFETNDPKQGWDGTFRGKEAIPGVYVYYLDATCYGLHKFKKKGNITLIR